MTPCVIQGVYGNESPVGSANLQNCDLGLVPVGEDGFIKLRLTVGLNVSVTRKALVNSITNGVFGAQYYPRMTPVNGLGRLARETAGVVMNPVRPAGVGPVIRAADPMDLGGQAEKTIGSQAGLMHQNNSKCPSN